MAAKKKAKKKAVKKAAGRKPVAQRAPRKKREPVPQHGLPPDPVGAQNPQADEPVGAVTNTAEVGVMGVPVGGTVGLDSGEGATEVEPVNVDHGPTADELEPDEEDEPEDEDGGFDDDEDEIEEGRNE